MSNSRKETKQYSFRIIDEDRKCYRDYHFLPESDDIFNKIFSHVMFFGQNTEFHDHKDMLQAFASLCHKVNILKYHLKQYRDIEQRIEKELSLAENFIDHDGVVLVEKVELTAHYEAFLLQVKATLDILVKFLNIIYRANKKKPLKYQSTFSDGGNGVIKSLENYIRNNPEEEELLSELLKYLKTACTDTEEKDSGSIHWLISIITKRNTVSHYRKHEYFAFQIDYNGNQKNITAPRLTHTQTILESFEIGYDNLLVFIQDFIALLFDPYLDNNIKAFTFRKSEVVDEAPKWYLQLGDLSPYLVKQNIGNISLINNIIGEKGKYMLSSEYYEKMYLHYSKFYR